MHGIRASGELMYIGRSKTIQDRLRKHERRTVFSSGNPTHFSFKIVPESLIAAVEVAHIRALAPFENMFMEASGSTLHDPMTAAIQQAWGNTAGAHRESIGVRHSALLEQIAARL